MTIRKYCGACRIPVDQQETQVCERVAEGRHLPVHDCCEDVRIMRIKDRIVQAVVAMDYRHFDFLGESGNQSSVEIIDPWQHSSAHNLPLAIPSVDLAPDVALRTPEF